MKRLLATVAVALGLLCHGASAATTGTSPIAYLYCQNAAGAWTPASPTNPCPVTGSAGGGGAALTNYSLETGGNLAAAVAALSQVLAAIKQPIPTSPPNSCSGAIATGGAAQILIPAGSVVHGFEVQDESADLMAVSWTTATPAPNTSGSYTMNPATATSAGGSYDTQLGMAPPVPVYINAPTKGDAFTCTWW